MAMETKKTRNRKRKMERDIAGKRHICPVLAAKFLGCSRSKLSDMIARSKAGKLKPALEWYRDTPRSPMWFNPEKLESFMLERSKIHA